MRFRIQVLRDHGLPVSEHVMNMGDDYVFPFEGGIVDKVTGYYLLGYKV